MINSIIAKRYAKALLELGREDGKEVKYGQELADMVGLMEKSVDFGNLLSNPSFDLEDRKKVLTKVLEKIKSTPIMSNFCKLLIDRGRISEIRSISIAYTKFLDNVRGITRAEVISAIPLKKDELQKLKKSLKVVVGRDVTLEVKEDPSLLGGLKAKIGDLVLDGSVKTQLESLKFSLRRGEYA